MRIDPHKLLSKLEPPVRPAAAPQSGARGRAPLETSSFDDLLGLVSTGELESGRSISVTGDLAEPLTEGQQRRLAAAADLAEANGVGAALMLIDGRAVVMDVPGRAVTDEPATADTSRVIALDAAVFVAGEDDDAGLARPPLPGRGVVPPALVARLFETRSGDAGGARNDDSTTTAAPDGAGG